jgi:hypothetical protein
MVMVIDDVIKNGNDDDIEDLKTCISNNGDLMYFNNENGAVGIMDAVIGGIVTIIGVLIVTNVNTAANLSGSTATMTGLIGLVLAAGGILYVVMRAIAA